MANQDKQIKAWIELLVKRIEDLEKLLTKAIEYHHIEQARQIKELIKINKRMLGD